jgi:uncharacterized membrane protein YgcG
MLVLPVGACNTSPTLRSVESDCLTRYGNYPQAWSCSRNNVAGTLAEYRTRYVTVGDTLLDQVNRGQISDAVARDTMAGGFARSGGGDFRGGGGRGGGGGRR